MSGLRIRRKPGESVWIGDARVTNTSKKAVVLNIEAPPGTKVMRTELKAIAENSPAPGTGEVLRHEDASGQPSR